MSERAQLSGTSLLSGVIKRDSWLLELGFYIPFMKVPLTVEGETA